MTTASIMTADILATLSAFRATTAAMIQMMTRLAMISANLSAPFCHHTKSRARVKPTATGATTVRRRLSIIEAKSISKEEPLKKKQRVAGTTRGERRVAEVVRPTE